jgi:dUTP pyrophosphatase
MRIAQMVIMPIIRVEIEEVDSLSSSIRGTDGFGSTGV